MIRAIPNTDTRVIERTDEEINQRLRREMEMRISYYSQNPGQIDSRLAELDREWDIERVLETNAAGISLVGILMASRNKKWLILPFAVAGFLMQHAINGWCPPVPFFRRMGVRTTYEINSERNALKALRGDFGHMDLSQDSAQRTQAAIAAAQQR